MEQIMKPMSVARNEFINGMTELINSCQLPPFVIEAVLKDMYNDVHILSQRQLEIDTQKYAELVKKAADGCPKK